MDKRLLTVMMFAILAALILTTVFYRAPAGCGPTRAKALGMKLAVAAKAPPMRELIPPGDVRVAGRPVSVSPAQAFRNIEDAVDRPAAGQLLANEPVPAGRVTTKDAAFGLSPLIPEGVRAMAIALHQVSGVSGLVLPRPKADVLLTGSPPGEKERATTTVLENAAALSTGQRTVPNANGQPEAVPVVNLLLAPEEAKKLTLAAAGPAPRAAVDKVEMIRGDRRSVQTSTAFAGAGL